MFEVPTWVGAAVGEDVGATVGCVVGLEVGGNVGVIVGLAVGAVGLWVGVRVGLSVALWCCVCVWMDGWCCENPRDCGPGTARMIIMFPTNLPDDSGRERGRLGDRHAGG